MKEASLESEWGFSVMSLALTSERNQYPMLGVFGQFYLLSLVSVQQM
jgi:hypothetical protein